MHIAEPSSPEDVTNCLQVVPKLPASMADSHAYHAMDASEVAAMLGTNGEVGLTPTEAERRLREYGSNSLATSSPTTWCRRVTRQLRETMVLLLLAAAFVALWLGEWVDSVAILSIVVVNTTLGVLQHYKAERTLAALKKLSAPTALVRRGGRLALLPAIEIVPGDCVELGAGDAVPADLRLFDGFGLLVQEAALTGESIPVEKLPQQSLGRETPLGERANCAFSGTTVLAGKARGVVVATGMNTELGRIGRLLNETERGATPLEQRLEHLGRRLVAVCLVLVIVIGLLYAWRGSAWIDILRMSIGLAVAAVPEGLPAVVTIALALGVQRMSRRNALVKDLASVETLGSVSVICSDKTGTLTRNEMTVRELRIGAGAWTATGSGYELDGEIVRSDEAADLENSVDRRKRDDDLALALRTGLHCNHARLERPAGVEEAILVTAGDPTELSLIIAAWKRGIRREREPIRILDEIPFDSRRKAMAVLCEDTDQRRTLYVKGSVEYVLAKSARYRDLGLERSLDASARQAVLDAAANMSERALRVLAIAYRSYSRDEAKRCKEEELIFLGLVGMLDPPRDEAREAVTKCRTAGIRPIMITGDHPLTAAAIGRSLGICGDSEKVLLGSEVERLSERELEDAVGKTSVFARVAPEHKLRIVQALQRRGESTAMTGDGVNDAPAVKAADIGVAMGIAGTQVTKEAASLVLLDDNFSTIVAAVEEGRTIFANIRRFITYLLAGNANKLLVMFTAVIMGWHDPLLALQILWLNLVTDGLPALALGLEPAEGDVMRQRPRSAKESLLGPRDLAGVLLPAVLMAVAALTGFFMVYDGDEARLATARVATFCIVGFGQLAFALTCRSRRESAWGLSGFSNRYLPTAVVTSALLQVVAVTLPGLRQLLGVYTELSSETWLLIAALSLAPALACEAFLSVRGVGRFRDSRVFQVSSVSSSSSPESP